MRNKVVFLCLFVMSFVPSEVQARWMKVRVDDTGIQEITYEQLRAAGFTDPSKVAVYGSGGIVEPGQGKDNYMPAVSVAYAADKLLFYGEGASRVSLTSTGEITRVRNVNSECGYYFITDSEPVRMVQVQSPVITSSGSVRDSHMFCRVLEDDVECPACGGTEFFGPDMISMQNPYDVRFDVVDMVPDGYVSVNYTYAVRNTMSSSVEAKCPAGTEVMAYTAGRCTGIFADDITYYTRSAGSLRFRPDVNQRINNVKISFSPSGTPSFAAVDYVTVGYERKNDIATLSGIAMYYPSVSVGDELRIDGWNDGCRLWGVSTDGQVSECTESSAGDGMGSYRVVSSDMTKYYAFNPALPQCRTVIEPAEIVMPELHDMDVPCMLVITSDALYAEALELAGIHKAAQGLDVAVVRQGDIFNEFSSGTPHPEAYRRMAKMLYDRDKDKFRYILLYGGGRYDNRLALRSDSAALMTYQCEQYEYMNLTTTVYCADTYFGMMADDLTAGSIGTAACDVAVGRIPLNDALQARMVNAKIKRYLESVPCVPLCNNALIICDDKDRNSHLQQAEEITGLISDRTGGAVTSHKVYHALYPLDSNNDAAVGRRMIRNVLQDGVGFMCYTGHTNGVYLTGHRIWGIGSIAETEIEYPPLVMWSTCDAYHFDRARTDLAQTAVFMPAGGAIGAIGSCRTAYQDYNGTLMRSVVDSLYSAEPDVMLGEVFRRARNGVVGLSAKQSDRKLAINTLCYNYCGDPALPFYNWHYDVSAQIGDGDMLKTASLNKISGYVHDENGNVVSDFNGTMTVTVYDSPYLKNTYPRGTDPVVSVSLDEEILAQKAVKVNDGRFEMSLFLPESVRRGADMRISFFAVSVDGDVRASGALSHVSVILSDQYPDYPDLATGLEIRSIHIGSQRFVAGDVVPANCTFQAVVGSGLSGVNMTQASVGMVPELRLDSRHTLPLRVSYDEDADMVLSANLHDLSAGEHFLELRVSDNMGRFESRIVSFTVADQVTAVLSADRTIVMDEVCIGLDHGLLSEPVCRLVVRDARGNTVLSRDNVSFPYAWNLTDNDGRRVPDGRYSAYVMLQTGNVSGCTPEVEMIVVTVADAADQ